MRFNVYVNHRIGRPELVAFVAHHMQRECVELEPITIAAFDLSELGSRQRLIDQYRKTVRYSGEDRFTYWTDGHSDEITLAILTKASNHVDSLFPEIKPTPKPYQEL